MGLEGRGEEGRGQRQECGDTGSCRSLCVQMPRLKGEFENWVAEVFVGRPPPKTPSRSSPLGKPKTLKINTSFTSPQRRMRLEAARVMWLWGAWTWLWPWSKGGKVFQPKLSVASTPPLMPAHQGSPTGAAEKASQVSTP